MNRRRTAIFRAGLDTLYTLRAHRALAPFTGGLGVIFTLHHVSPGPPADFAPNRILSVTPEFLDQAVRRIREAGVDIVSLDEARQRILGGRAKRRFACLTFDDGYRDNMEIARPVLERHGVPFTIYLTTGMPDGTVELWWLALERAIARADAVEFESADGAVRLECADADAKYAAYEAIYWRLRDLSQADRLSAVRALAARHDVDVAAITRELALTWDEIVELERDPLVTIGAHTLSHPALAGLTPAEAEYEMAESRRRIGERTGVRPRHLSFPYGDAGSAAAREFACAQRLGFSTAVTTRPGLIFPEHAGHLTALPRVSLNGDYQSPRYLDLYLTGAPFALWNRFRRVDAA